MNAEDERRRKLFLKHQLKVYGKPWDETFEKAERYSALMKDLHDTPDPGKIRSICQFLSTSTATCDEFLSRFWCQLPTSMEQRNSEAVILNTLIWYLSSFQRAHVVATLTLTAKKKRERKDDEFVWLAWLRDGKRHVEASFLDYVAGNVFQDMLYWCPHELIHISLVAQRQGSNFLLDCLQKHKHMFEEKLSYEVIKALFLPHSFYERYRHEYSDYFTHASFMDLMSCTRHSVLPFLMKEARKHVARYLRSPEDSETLSLLLCNRIVDPDGVKPVFEMISNTIVECLVGREDEPLRLQADYNTLQVVARNVTNDRLLYKNLCKLVGVPATKISFLSVYICQSLVKRVRGEDLRKLQNIFGTPKHDTLWKRNLILSVLETQIPYVLESLEKMLHIKI